MDIISVLPQEILERILYFLPQEDAVRTSVLSKSWRHVWCARPNLAFSVQTFKGKRQDFLITVDKTIQRYRDQRLCVEEFDLCILVDGSDCPSVTFLENWIPLLKHMGMKKFDLSIHSRYSWAFIDMPSVVFGAESLQYLHVAKFVMDQKCIERIVLLKHLDQLHLEQVYIEDAVFQRIISSCPSIETMIIEGCEGLKKINLSDLPNLIYFNFDVVYEDELEEEPCSIEIHAPSSIETINISFGNIWFCKGAEFRNLINLHLRGVDSSLEHMSSCKFPILVWLSLSDCEGLKDIKLFIDAPSMLLFEYQGFFIPSISFGKTTSSWRSELNINYMQINNGYLWFLELNELLNSVSKSRIILLSLNASLSAGSSNLDGLLRICRPRILMHLDMEVVEWLWKLLMERESGDEGDWFRQLWLRDLEQASLEIRESGREEWRSATLSELRKCRETKSYRTRFALKWRQAS
ncbi:hypothetical protein MIMGU_mgv1a026746mg [Erythranthe guttata]|uniref:F-box domain-containing protein n=1 Tax=Erythranthe guttata TaxID=4155 RepID=A0A022RPI5_ERYGU|nr:hypothetical protein MIMGU_mgv1a026746mg [Erythranthe guttata]